MKRIIALLLALILTLSLVACGEAAPEQTEPATTEATKPAPDAPNTQPVQLPEGAPNYFQLSISDEQGNYKSLSAFEDGNGSITVDYQGDIRKVTTMELDVMAAIAEAFAKTGLAAFNGENIYEDGLASASMYISYADGSYLGAGYSGTIPQAFLDEYDVMDAWFQSLLADVPEYVARPVVMGEVNADALKEIEAILDASGMEPLDMFTISDVAMDEFFGATMGLSSAEGIASGTSCGPMMSTTAYSCVIAELTDESKAADVQKDFAANVDWNRWVCVSANAALIAQKGNMVLCLVSSGELYGKTASAIEANGWTVLETLTNN